MSRLKEFPRTFWVANTMEIFERMAWYGFFAVSSLYITGKVADGGLGFSDEDRGVLQLAGGHLTRCHRAEELSLAGVQGETTPSPARATQEGATLG